MGKPNENSDMRPSDTGRRNNKLLVLCEEKLNLRGIIVHKGKIDSIFLITTEWIHKGKTYSLLLITAEWVHKGKMDRILLIIPWGARRQNR